MTSSGSAALWIALALLCACGRSGAPGVRSAAPDYVGKPAVRFALDVRPLGFDPDGNARAVAIVKFFDARGRLTRILANSDVDWRSNARVQWQTRMRWGQPSAIVSTNAIGKMTLTAHVDKPEIGSRTVVVDPRAWAGARVVARALGPYAVAIGWYPRENGVVRIDRVDRTQSRETIATIAGPSSSYLDATARPGHRYRYVVYRSDAPVAKPSEIRMPSPLPREPIANVSAKGMWFTFSTNPVDANYCEKLDPQAIVAQAVRAGLHYVELRTAYGGFFEITPVAKRTIDAIIEGLAARHIGTIAWTVPRDAGFEDLAQSVRSAYYTTANGTRVTGIAVDLERGDEFMGGASQGPSALWQYVAYLREALGPRALIVSTVEDPYLGHLTQADYPYAQIAQYSSVLQPMAYWRMMRRDPTTPENVRVLLRASYAKLEHEAGRAMPISVGGQSEGEGPSGAPSANEITASLEASRAAGALGEAFFAWDGTRSEQWNALRDYRW